MTQKIEWNNLFATLGEEISTLAGSTLAGYAREATADTKDFLDTSKADLKNWAILYAQGNISKDDLRELILGQKDLSRMVALKQAGLAQISIDKFRNAMIEKVVTTITGTLF
jgi:hypothetical protein